MTEDWSTRYGLEQWLHLFECDGAFDGDWTALAQWAAERGVLPLLASWAATAPSVPAELCQQFESVRSLAVARNLIQLNALASLVKAFNAAGVPIIILKGAAMLGTIYPSLASREMGDVDVLIRPEDLERAAQILTEHGYRYPLDVYPGHPTAYILRYLSEMSFTVAQPWGPEIDLHWRLVNHEWYEGVIRIDTTGVWARSRSVDLDGVTALGLSIEDLIWHLCLHASLHKDGQLLRRLIDIDRVIRSEAGAVDFEALVQRVRTYHIKSLVYFSLAAATNWLRTPVSETVLARLKPSAWQLRVINRLVTPHEALAAQERSRTTDRLLQLVLADTGLDRLKMIRNAILPSPEWISMHYHVHGPIRIGVYRLRHFYRSVKAAGLQIKQAFTSRVFP